MREAVVTAYVDALQLVWLVMTVLAGTAFLASVFWTQEISLERELETDQGFIHERKDRKRSALGDQGQV